MPRRSVGPMLGRYVVCLPLGVLPRFDLLGFAMLCPQPSLRGMAEGGCLLLEWPAQFALGLPGQPWLRWALLPPRRFVSSPAPTAPHTVGAAGGAALVQPALVLRPWAHEPLLPQAGRPPSRMGKWRLRALWGPALRLEVGVGRAIVGPRGDARPVTGPGLALSGLALCGPGCATTPRPWRALRDVGWWVGVA